MIYLAIDKLQKFHKIHLPTFLIKGSLATFSLKAMAPSALNECETTSFGVLTGSSSCNVTTAASKPRWYYPMLSGAIGDHPSSLRVKNLYSLCGNRYDITVWLVHWRDTIYGGNVLWWLTLFFMPFFNF